MQWTDVKYFKPAEFDSPDFPGSGELNMSLDLIYKLDMIREAINSPLTITSGFRTYAHNRVIGGAVDSAHLKGLAADLTANEPGKRFDILKAALLFGFTRIEIAPAHIHVDIDLGKRQRVALFLPSYSSKETL